MNDNLNQCECLEIGVFSFKYLFILNVLHLSKDGFLSFKCPTFLKA